MNAKQIFEQLLAGKVVQINFPTKAAFQSLRSSIQNNRAKNTKSLNSMGVEGNIFGGNRIAVYTDPEGNYPKIFPTTVTITIGNRVARTKHEYTILTVEDGAEIRTDMGST